MELPGNVPTGAPVRGLVIDLGGTVEVDGVPLPGALEAIRLLRRQRKRLLFLSNSTTEPRTRLLERLRSHGLDLGADELLTPPAAAARLLASRGSPACLFVVREEIQSEFAGIPGDEDRPDYVVIGDIGERWDYPLMSRLFRLVMSGAKLLALHKGRYWETQEGLALDIGAFIAGIEYATGIRAEVVGKPSSAYFEEAVAALGLPIADVIAIGDDVDSDIGGAQAVGLRGVLVRTGKYRDDFAARSPVKPWRVINSVADLPRLLGIG